MTTSPQTTSANAEPFPPMAMRKEDKIYTAALAALAFISLIGMITLWAVIHSPTFPPSSLWVIQSVIAIQGCYLLFEVAVLTVRMVFPARRKWPTIALNIVLCLSFPLGTILGVFGLWKVDKPTHDAQRAI